MKNILASISLILVLASCQKEQETPPSATLEPYPTYWPVRVESWTSPGQEVQMVLNHQVLDPFTNTATHYYHEYAMYAGDTLVVRSRFTGTIPADSSSCVSIRVSRVTAHVSVDYICEQGTAWSTRELVFPLD